MIKEMFGLSPKRLLAYITGICLFVYLSAYIMEHQFGVLSCKLCVYERLVFVAAGILAFIAFLLFPPKSQSLFIFLIGLIFLGGGILALYHVGIQNHLISLPEFCNTQDFGKLNSVQALKEALLQTPFVRCDQVTFSFLGVSLAGYNAILSFFLAGFCWGWTKFHVMDPTIKG